MYIAFIYQIEQKEDKKNRFKFREKENNGNQGP